MGVDFSSSLGGGRDVKSGGGIESIGSVKSFPNSRGGEKLGGRAILSVEGRGGIGVEQGLISGRVEVGGVGGEKLSQAVIGLERVLLVVLQKRFQPGGRGRAEASEATAGTAAGATTTSSTSTSCGLHLLGSEWSRRFVVGYFK